MKTFLQVLFFSLLIYLNNSFAQTFTKINAKPFNQDAFHSQGCSWGDYDNDGNVDVFIVFTSAYGGNKANLLYRNLGNGNFKKIITGTIPNDIIITAGGSGSWGDYDNDGDLDLYTSVASGNNRLYRNDGNDNFTKFEIFGGGNSDGTWADYENDGDLDMFISSPGGPNRVFKNNGSGSFTQIDTGAIAVDNYSFMSPSWVDFDNDGDMDVMWTTCFFDGHLRNKFYLNQGGGYFTRMDSNAVILSDNNWSTGSSWGDYDNDGYMDAYVTNFRPNEEINHLYHNNRNGTFTKLTLDPQAADSAATGGSLWADFDNDGDLDLLVLNEKFSLAPPLPGYTKNLFLRNDGSGNFTSITNNVIAMDYGHSAGTADYDNDGDLDVVITNGSISNVPDYNCLYRNEGNNNKWINILCEGTTSNKSAIGTRIKIKANINGSPVWQMREIAQMTGCHANSDLRVHFGLGNASSVDSIVIRWPSGLVKVYTGIAVNNFYRAVEGQNLVAYYPKNIFPENPSIDKLFARKNLDSILFRTTFQNPYNHPFTARLLLSDSTGTYSDSLTLYDDGNHGDSLNNDGIYGTYIPPRTLENFFIISTSTLDNQLNKYYKLQDISRFTTVPLIIDSIQIGTAGNFRYTFKPYLKNNGTVHNINYNTVTLKSDDPWVTLIYPETRPCNNIAPGQSVTVSSFAVTYDSASFPGYFNLKFEITTGGQLYWIYKVYTSITGIDDNFENIPAEYRLSQNYPNPFNPVTKLSYSLPQPGLVILKVFDILGNQIQTLIDEEKPAGTYELNWNAANLPSGVYFYRIQAGSFVQTKKMVLMK